MRSLVHKKIAAVTAACSSAFWAVAAFAQDQTQQTQQTTEPIRTTTTSWYAEPWVWAVGVGVAIFLVVVIALTNRGGSSSSRA